MAKMKSDMAVAVVMNLFTVEVLLTLYICFFYTNLASVRLFLPNL